MTRPKCSGRRSVSMLDDFLVQKLQGIQSQYNALTERLGDPDLIENRTEMLTVTRERAGMEATVEAFVEWKAHDNEAEGLVELEQDDGSDTEMKAMARDEMRGLRERQHELSAAIKLMLLPRDPNDDRNVMLEVRAGAGGDEASIWVGDLVAMYKKYSDVAGWSIKPVSDLMCTHASASTC